MVFYVLFASYTAVLLAEVLGDRSLYTVSALAARFRALPVLCGLVVAFLGKMGFAVLLGGFLARLPAALVAGLSAGTFVLTGVILWRRQAGEKTATAAPLAGGHRAVLASFSAIFFTEWADAGQVTAAALTARYSLPFVVWLGASAALATKGLLALALGAGLRHRVPGRTLRIAGLTLGLTMALLAVLRI